MEDSEKVLQDSIYEDTCSTRSIIQISSINFFLLDFVEKTGIVGTAFLRGTLGKIWKKKGPQNVGRWSAIPRKG